MAEKLMDLPPEIRGATLSKKARWIAREGIRAKAADPLYGTPEETDTVLFRVGPDGHPYSNTSQANHALATMNIDYSDDFDGRFEGTSRRTEFRQPKGFLLVRFIPNDVSNTGGEAAE